MSFISEITANAKRLLGGIPALLLSATLLRRPLATSNRYNRRKDLDEALAMDSLFDDQYSRAIQIGEENLRILHMASAWCENIDVTKGPLGTGLVEQLTFLPISGGSLRCDFATAPTTFAMPLANTAVEFYEQNCIGCPNRKATDQTNHLGTWADAHIREREKREAEAELRRSREESACEERARGRRFMFGEPDPSLQSILDLLDRVDTLQVDAEAGKLLVKHAEMAPGDFPDELVEHLANEAMTIASGAFLEATIAIFDRQGRPATEKMLEIAFKAVERNIAGEAAGLVIASHAQEFPVGVSQLAPLVKLAAGEPDSLRARRKGAEPAALLHFFDRHPDGAVKVMVKLLTEEDVWTRAYASHAAEKLVAARPSSGRALLPALLDSLVKPDNSSSLGDPFAAAQAAKVVADIFVVDSGDTDLEISKRIDDAEAGTSKRLWNCYSSAIPSRFRDQVPTAVTKTILNRALKLLRTDLDTELLPDVAETVSYLYSRQDKEVAIPLQEMVDLACIWVSRQREMETNRSPTESLSLESFFAFESERQAISAICARLREALKGAAKKTPDDYISLIEKRIDTSKDHFPFVFFLDVLRAAVSVPETFQRAIPLLRRALTIGSIRERASALRIIGRTGPSTCSVPQDFADQVLQALKQENLAVFIGAIYAARRVKIPENDKPRLISLMLTFAKAYGEERIYTRDVESALRLVLVLAHGQSYQEKVGQAIVTTIASLPSAEAVELLRALDLKDIPTWPTAAVSALREDSDPSYKGIGDWTRQDLVRELARRPTDKIAPYFDDLVEIALQRFPDLPWWALAVGDILALHQEHERAAKVFDKVVEEIPDTREKQPLRSFFRQVALGHHANAAAVLGDQEKIEHLLAEWDLLLDDEEYK